MKQRHRHSIGMAYFVEVVFARFCEQTMGLPSYEEKDCTLAVSVFHDSRMLQTWFNHEIAYVTPSRAEAF